MTPTSLRIRPALSTDAAEIAFVHVMAWKQSYPGLMPDEFLAQLDVASREKWWQKNLARTGNPSPAERVFVADIDGAVVGFVSGGPLREPLADFDSELYAIYLLNNFKRQGVGAQLFSALYDSLRAGGIGRMALWVLEKNPACHFYRRMGGVPLGVTKDVNVGGHLLSHVAYGWSDSGPP